MFWYLLTRCAVATRKERISRWDYRFLCNIFLFSRSSTAASDAFELLAVDGEQHFTDERFWRKKVGNRLFINSSSRTSILTDRRRKKKLEKNYKMFIQSAKKKNNKRGSKNIKFAASTFVFRCCEWKMVSECVNKFHIDICSFAFSVGLSRVLFSNNVWIIHWLFFFISSN